MWLPAPIGKEWGLHRFGLAPYQEMARQGVFIWRNLESTYSTTLLTVDIPMSMHLIIFTILATTRIAIPTIGRYLRLLGMGLQNTSLRAGAFPSRDSSTRSLHVSALCRRIVTNHNFFALGPLVPSHFLYCTTLGDAPSFHRRKAWSLTTEKNLDRSPDSYHFYS